MRISSGPHVGIPLFNTFFWANLSDQIINRFSEPKLNYNINQFWFENLFWPDQVLKRMQKNISSKSEQKNIFSIFEQEKNFTFLFSSEKCFEKGKFPYGAWSNPDLIPVCSDIESNYCPKIFWSNINLVPNPFCDWVGKKRIHKIRINYKH